MLTPLPAPLTPEDCDLQDFKFMPLDVARLRDSDMASEQTPEENWAAVLLWAAAWHQVPAGSMPDSDNWIAKAAGYMSRGRIDARWKDIKAGAMRGFVLCSDGRWYHQVVSEKANESWIGKLKQRLKTECSRIKKHNDRHGTKVPFPEFETWFVNGCPVGQPLPVPRDTTQLSLGTQPPCPFDVPTQTPSKGQGEGQGEGQLTSKADDDNSTDSGSALSSSDPAIDLPPAGSDFDPPAGAPLPMREAPPINQDPAVILSVALRRQGVNCMSTHPVLQDWASKGVTLAVLTEAISLARETKGNDPIHPNYLAPIVTKLLNPPPATPQGSSTPRAPAAPRKPKGNDPKGLDESYDDYNARITKAEAERRKGQP